VPGEKLFLCCDNKIIAYHFFAKKTLAVVERERNCTAL